MTGALRRDAYVLPGQTVSVRRIYKLLLLMLPGKGVTKKQRKGVTKKQPPLPDSKEAEWSLQDLLLNGVYRICFFIMSGHAVKCLAMQ